MLPFVTRIQQCDPRSRAPFVVGYVSDPKAHKKSYFFVIAQSVNGVVEFTPPFTGVTLFGKRCGAISDAGLDTNKVYGLQVVYVHNRLPADVMWLEAGDREWSRDWKWVATIWYEQDLELHIRLLHHFLWEYKNLVQCDDDDEQRVLPPLDHIPADTIMLLD